MDVMDFGNLADWVAAVGSLGALVVAALAWLTARRVGAREEARAKRDQAEKISAWFASEIREERVLAWGIMLKNSSPNLVYDVEVVAKSKLGGTTKPLRLTSLPPGTYWVSWGAKAKAWEFPVDSSGVENELRPVVSSERLGIQFLRFRDASDGVWKREEQGSLTVSVTG
jgi:hypothetical protein